MLNRTLAPDFRPVLEVKLPKAHTVSMANGCPLRVINIGQQAVMRLEIIFEAGMWYEQIPHTASFAIKMLSEGTQKHNSAQISEYFDQMGAFLDLSHTTDRANVTVYGQPKHLEAILVMVREILTEAAFPEKELDNIRNINLQNLKINQEKNGYLATTRFRKQLYGEQHPYGRSQQKQYIEAATQAQVVEFYQRHIQQCPFQVFLSGKIAEQDVLLTQQYLGNIPISQEVAITKHSFDQSPKVETIQIDKADALQSSIRIGQRLFTRSHPDFFPFLVCNEVLGGYFGSRLMKNIREDKGFTYGISSGITLMKNDGYMAINTDVKKQNCADTLTEIQREIDLLQNELVPANELETVLNFMSGEMAGNLNTPFEIADRVRVMALDGLPDDFYNHYIERIRSVSATQIMDIAQRYFVWDNFTKVIVG